MTDHTSSRTGEKAAPDFSFGRAFKVPCYTGTGRVSVFSIFVNYKAWLFFGRKFKPRLKGQPKKSHLFRARFRAFPVMCLPGHLIKAD